MEFEALAPDVQEKLKFDLSVFGIAYWTVDGRYVAPADVVKASELCFDIKFDSIPED